jgi:uncharacterized protein with HEPN domain
MQKDIVIYLDDIIFSIALIERYIEGISQESFEESYDTQDKVMRRLEIIAEAAKRLPEEIRSQHSDIPWKSIIGLRNIIVHNYDNVNLQEVWQIVKYHLPETKKQIELLKSNLKK